jgi:hypothetical protein
MIWLQYLAEKRLRIEFPARHNKTQQNTTMYIKTRHNNSSLPPVSNTAHHFTSKYDTINQNTARHNNSSLPSFQHVTTRHIKIHQDIPRYGKTQHNNSSLLPVSSTTPHVTTLHGNLHYCKTRHNNPPKGQEKMSEINDDSDFTFANIEIRGMAPYSQSHMHADPFLEGESPEDYEKRCWRSKMNTATLEDGTETMVVPGFAFQRALAAGAKFSKKQMAGYGRSTWTKRFESGVAVMGDGILNVITSTVKPIVLPMNSDGRRGGGKRVIRWLPQIPAGWKCQFEVTILDSMITQDVFREMAQSAGQFIGLGQFRPENGGMNGRFVITQLDWADNRRALQAKQLSFGNQKVAA